MAPPAAPTVGRAALRPPARAPAAGAPRAGRRRIQVRRAGRVLQAGCAGAGHPPCLFTASVTSLCSCSSRPSSARNLSSVACISARSIPLPAPDASMASSVLILSGSAACFSAGLYVTEIGHLPSPSLSGRAQELCLEEHASGCGIAQGYRSRRSAWTGSSWSDAPRAAMPEPNAARKQMALNTRTVSVRARGDIQATPPAAAALSRAQRPPLFRLRPSLTPPCRSEPYPETAQHSPRPSPGSSKDPPQVVSCRHRYSPPRRSELQLGSARWWQDLHQTNTPHCCHAASSEASAGRGSPSAIATHSCGNLTRHPASELREGPPCQN